MNIDPLVNVASATLSETVAVGFPTIRGGGGPYNCETMLCEDEDIRNLDEGYIEDLSLEGPFDVPQDTSRSGASPRVLGQSAGLSIPHDFI